LSTIQNTRGPICRGDCRITCSTNRQRHSALVTTAKRLWLDAHPKAVLDSPPGCFGLWTTALPTAARKRSLGCKNRYANLTLVHGPVHASWLNQIEIYFPSCNKRCSPPMTFLPWRAVADRLAEFERHYEQIAKPFQWRFTRRNLNDWLEKLAQQDRPQSALAALTQRIR